MFHVIPGNFFTPLSSPNRIVYWECICKLFSTMEHQLSFGVERDVLVDELEYLSRYSRRKCKKKSFRHWTAEEKRTVC